MKLAEVHQTVIRTIKTCTAKNQWPLYLWGETGVGKTCGAAAAYSLWKQPAVFMSLTEHCDILKAFNVNQTQLIPTSGGKVELTQTGYWDRLRKLGLVVIDEIGTRDASPQRYDSLLRLLEIRHGKPLILTGNIEPTVKLATVYDERVQSRIVAGVILQVLGNDRRLDGLRERVVVAE